MPVAVNQTLPPIATFSIVAFDANRQEWGVAVQSKFLACAALVSWAKAEAGAVATQSYVNVAYGPHGLELMAQGLSARQAIERLTRADEQQARRQVGMVDRSGQAAAFTGSECHDWAGHIVGDGFACQGNILLPGTVEAMAGRFEQLRGGEGELADWLVEALRAGQAAGGDSRGRQAAGVLVVRQHGGYGGNTDRYLDLRVDDDPQPIERLANLLQQHHLLFGQANPNDIIPMADVTAELQAILQRTGHYTGPLSGQFDAATGAALWALVGRENLEERWNGYPHEFDRLVVDYLREKFSGEAL